MSSRTYRGLAQNIYMLTTPQHPQDTQAIQTVHKSLFFISSEKRFTIRSRWIPCRWKPPLRGSQIGELPFLHVKAQSRRAFLSTAPRPWLSAAPALGRISYSGTLWELSSRWWHGHRKISSRKVSPSAASDVLCPTPL
jgi:hypothetical protein